MLARVLHPRVGFLRPHLRLSAGLARVVHDRHLREVRTFQPARFMRRQRSGSSL